MIKYKTAVVDYEGMQECLDHHSAQGWRLFCVNADTWRKVQGDGVGENGPPAPLGMSAEATAIDVYSASYYLLVFMREEDPRRTLDLAEAAQERPREQRHRHSY